MIVGGAQFEDKRDLEVVASEENRLEQAQVLEARREQAPTKVLMGPQAVEEWGLGDLLEMMGPSVTKPAALSRNPGH